MQYYEMKKTYKNEKKMSPGDQITKISYFPKVLKAAAYYLKNRIHQIVL